MFKRGNIYCATKTLFALVVISAVRVSDSASVNATNGLSNSDKEHSSAAGAAPHIPGAPTGNSSGRGGSDTVYLNPATFPKRLLDKCADNRTRLTICDKLRSAIRRGQEEVPATSKNSTGGPSASVDASVNGASGNSTSNTIAPAEETQIVKTTDEEVSGDDVKGGLSRRTEDSPEADAASSTTVVFGRPPGGGNSPEDVPSGPEVLDKKRPTTHEGQDADEKDLGGQDSPGCPGGRPGLKQVDTVAGGLFAPVLRFFASLLAVEGQSSSELYVPSWNPAALQAGESGHTPTVDPGVSGRAKVKRLFSHLTALLVLKAVTVGAVLLGAAKLVAGKALLLSAASFLLAAVLGLKRLAASGGGKAVIVHASRPGGGGGAGGWDEYHEGWEPFRQVHRRQGGGGGGGGGHPYGGYYDAGSLPPPLSGS